MPIPAKPCEGRFNDEVLDALSKNRDRAQWANHTCEVCGLSIGATLDKGKWVPEQHWPSVKYHPRNAAEKKNKSAAKAASSLQTDSKSGSESIPETRPESSPEPSQEPNLEPQHSDVFEESVAS